MTFAFTCHVGPFSGVKRLAKLGLVKAAPGMAALDMNSAEDAVVNHTREVVPGMVICGMEVGTPEKSEVARKFKFTGPQPAKSCLTFNVACSCLPRNVSDHIQHRALRNFM